MIFSVQPIDLKNLFSAIKMIPVNKVMPIDDYALFRPTEDGTGFVVIATDGECTCSVRMPVDEAQDLKPVLVARDFLSDFIGGALNEWPVTFDIDKSGNLVISDILGEFRTLANLDVSEFPVIQSIENSAAIDIDANLLVETTTLALPFMADDKLRPIMNGVNFDFRADGLRVSASDSKRLYHDVISDVVADGNPRITLPGKIAKCVAGLLHTGEEEKVSVVYNDKMIGFSQAGIRIIGCLLEGKYPNVEAILPKNSDKVVTVEREKILSVIKRVLIGAADQDKLVKVTFDGNTSLYIETRDEDFGRSASAVCDTVSQSGIEESFTMSFRGDALMKNISVFRKSDTVTFFMTERFRAMVIKSSPDSHRLALGMPYVDSSAKN